MQPINLFVSPKLAAAAQDSTSNLLTVPEEAATARGGARKWTERLQIMGATVEPILDNDGKSTARSAYRIRFKVAALSPTPNVGRNTSASYLVNFSAPEGSGDHTMTTISLGRVFSMLRACGYEINLSEGFDLSPFFGQESPLRGLEVNAVLTDKLDRNDPTIRRQDIGQFTKTED